ncbi:MAG TPA: glucose/galactose MFS transporter [Bacteroidales bacterium]|nr:MAG: glucose/galactose MFS transporter [Bacteroidetes bacterium GWF2_35_48]OFZ02471.1 MAG: glucose/galactose MFS transporter [Bacteroidetes bacterium RIFOXYC12_FULL_35_7]HBX50057.1 glucose/galactose MFS transporter [Bacteroidales bacterium]
MKNRTSSYIIPIIILGVLFFIFGFVTWLNGTLIPYLRIACELNTFQSLLVTFAFYISYFVMAIPSSWVLKKTGFKKGMMLGLLVMAVGALLFVPAALSRTYLLFLTGLFIIGTGLSVLQTASNPYITILGPIESAAKRISIMGICNKVAGVLAPLVLGAIVLSDADHLVEKLTSVDTVEKALLLDGLASRVIIPYVIIASVLMGLALMVRFSPLPDIEKENDADAATKNIVEKTSVFQFPNLVLGVIALFLYVGVEVLAGDTIGNYGLSQGIPLSEAKNFTAFTLAAMVIGYIIGIISIPKFISQSKALTISAVIGIVFSLLALFTSGYTSVFFIALLGLANALVWPAIWPLALNGLGNFIKIASALLIMAIAGGALLPLLYGKLADISFIGAQNAYWILIPAYIFILFYSIKGYKIKKW